jgi:hypothetical protein
MTGLDARMLRRRSRTTRARWAWGVVLAGVVAGCDPGEDPQVALLGPSFLIVAPAADQPTSPEEGTTIYVQARGGTFVGITTYEGRHRYSALVGDAVESCAELPGSEPLYLLVKPDDEECIVEARLYADCDPGEGGSALQMCNNHSSFVASAIVPIGNRRFNQTGPSPSIDASIISRPSDAGRDAAGDVASDRPRTDAGDAANRGGG